MDDAQDEGAKGPRITRRMVLATGALVAAPAMLLGGRALTWWDKDPSEGYRTLHTSEARILDSLAEAYFPPGGTPALSGADAGISAYMDAVFDQMTEPTPTMLRTLLHALNDLARLEGASYVELPLETRSRLLEGWLTHDNHLLRGAVTGLTTFVASAYCGHPDVRDACGWQFPCGYER